MKNKTLCAALALVAAMAVPRALHAQNRYVQHNLVSDLPGVAEVAMQSGIHAARTIKRRVSGGGESKPFRYRDLGSMASIARFSAVVDFKGLRVSGLP